MRSKRLMSCALQQVPRVALLLSEHGHQQVAPLDLLLLRGLGVDEGALDDAVEAQGLFRVLVHAVRERPPCARLEELIQLAAATGPGRRRSGRWRPGRSCPRAAPTAGARRRRTRADGSLALSNAAFSTASRFLVITSFLFEAHYIITLRSSLRFEAHSSSMLHLSGYSYWRARLFHGLDLGLRHLVGDTPRLRRYRSGARAT